MACVLGVAIGCQGGKRKSTQHVEVSGTVTYNGKPVTGGQIKFVGEDWAGIEGIIDEKGHYTINAPTGSNKIAIDNRLLQQGVRKEASRGVGRPGGPEPTPMKGKYIKIPDKYYDPAGSGLSYTVTKDAQQTFDVKLTD